MVSESFKARVPAAAFWEAWVASVLARAGLWTMHYPFEITDNKDLTDPDLIVASQEEYIWGPGANARAWEVEIKGLNLTFHNPETYPFEEVLVCSQNSFLRKWPGRKYTVRDFLLVSQKTGDIVWIPAMTPVTLGKEVHDKSRNETYKAVTVRKEDLRPLADFVEQLKELGSDD